MQQPTRFLTSYPQCSDPTWARSVDGAIQTARQEMRFANWSVGVPGRKSRMRPSRVAKARLVRGKAVHGPGTAGAGEEKFREG